DIIHRRPQCGDYCGYCCGRLLHACTICHPFTKTMKGIETLDTGMKVKYVTIWSRSTSGGVWGVERSHTEDYALALTGLRVGEWARINGRYYGVFEEGHNPNKGSGNKL